MTQNFPKDTIRTLRKNINRFFLRGDKVVVIGEKRPYKKDYAVYVHKVDNPERTAYIFTKYLEK